MIAFGLDTIGHNLFDKLRALHRIILSILFYMIANRWYPGWGWHPWM